MANSNTTYGLTVGDSKEPVPLKKLEVRTEIQGFIASTTYTLTYENEEDKPVEASFVFPMDDASALFHFEAEIEGRRIVAECQDKEQAKQTYDDAMEAGKSAFLVAESEQSRDIFKCDVGNLPPKTSALVRMSYVTELDLQADGAVLYVFPVTIFDRYELRPEDQGTSRSLKRAKLARGEIPYELDFQLKALSPREISKVEFVDTRDEKEANSDYGQEDAKYYAQTRIAGNFHWDHDVSIKVHYSDPFEPHVVAEKGKPDGEGILKDDMVMLNFFPNLEGEGTRFSKAELVFVMDRSGSMNGDNIEHAKQALLECLKILPDECTFNIVSFGSTHTKMFPRQSRKVNAKNIEEAKKEVKIMTANMGGTEILQPLKDIMSSDATDEYPRQVFLFTDGGVSNSDGVISFIKENAHTTRVFTFGIGQGVSTSLVKRSAHAGKGKYVLVKDTKDLPTLAAQTLKCAMQPNVDDVTITFTPSVDPTFFPKVLPPIFSGERLIAYAVLRKASKDKLEASLKGKVNGRLVHHSLKFSLTDTASELAPVHRLGAKAAIKQMEEDEDWQENKANIIIMSTAANVVSKYTAFIGVDHEGQTMQEAAVKRPLPVPMVQPNQLSCIRQMEQPKCPPRGGFRGGFRGGRGGSMFGSAGGEPLLGARGGYGYVANSSLCLGGAVQFKSKQVRSRSRDRARNNRDQDCSKSLHCDHDSAMESRAEKEFTESSTFMESGKGTTSSTSEKQSGVTGFKNEEVQKILKHRDEMASSVEVMVKQLTEAQMRELLSRIVKNQPGMVLDMLQPMDQAGLGSSLVGQAGSLPQDPARPPSWCTCKNCRTMPTAQENVCCGHRPELCLAQMPDMETKLQPFLLELQQKQQNETVAFNTGKDDAKSETERNKAKMDIFENDNAAKREAAYRMFVYWWRGTMGAGNTVVIPSCVVLHVRAKYPDKFNNYTQDSTRIVLFGKKLFEN